MSSFMDLDSSWLLSGSHVAVDDLFCDGTLPTWEGYHVSSSTLVNDYVALHPSTPGIAILDYNVEMVGYADRKSSAIEGTGSWLEDQFSMEPLPGSPEVGHMTDQQMRHSAVMLEMVPDITHYAGNVSSKSPFHATVPQTIDWKHFQPGFSMTSEHAFEQEFQSLADQSVATVPDCATEAHDVIDLLNQLSDSMVSDIYIDQVDMESFVSYPLHPISPDDVESLLSSPLSTVGTEVAETNISSFRTLAATVWSSEPHSPSEAPMEDMVIGSPMSDVPVVERKRKKQDQNKSAALRYRQKKRSEHGSVMTECEELERRNIELKTKVAEMAKEVDYLKGLIEEICAA